MTIGCTHGIFIASVVLICDHGTLSDGHLISLRLRAPKGLVPCLLKHWSAGVRDFWGGVSGKTHLYLLITNIMWESGFLCTLKQSNKGVFGIKIQDT